MIFLGGGLGAAGFSKKQLGVITPKSVPIVFIVFSGILGDYNP